MKLQSAARLWLVAAAASVGQVWSSFHDEETHRRRTLKEQALHSFERFLGLLQRSEKGTAGNEEYIKTTRVFWNGNRLLPIDHEGGDVQEGKTLSGGMGESMPDLSNGNVMEEKRMGRIGRSRKNRHGRRIKGTKSSKDKIPKTVKSSLKVIRKKPKEGDGGSQEVLCFTGFRKDVIKACEMYNAGCCVGNQACQWYDDNDSRKTTVCQGSCNDDYACKGIAPGSYISENSCRDRRSCEYLAASSLEKDPVYIGPGSCIGVSACKSICQVSDQCQVEIEGNSCVDPNSGKACFSMGSKSPDLTSVYVGSNSCVGSIACEYLGAYNDQITEIGIDKNACSTDFACASLGGASKGDEILILTETCTGYKSCFRLGFTAQDVLLEDQACQDYKSCYEIGSFSSNGIVSIGPKSCRGFESCFHVGQKTFESVLVSGDACVNKEACLGVGNNVVYDNVVIGELACSTEAYQCSARRDATCSNTANIPRYATSCSG